MRVTDLGLDGVNQLKILEMERCFVISTGNIFCVSNVLCSIS